MSLSAAENNFNLFCTEETAVNPLSPMAITGVPINAPSKDLSLVPYTEK